MSRRPEPKRKEFIQRLRSRLTQLEMNQADLADALGMSQSSISDWFNPSIAALPDGEKMLLLPEALKVNGHWLLTGEGPLTPPGTEKRDGEVRASGALHVIGRIREFVDEVEKDVGRRR